MILGRVVGTLWATRKCRRLEAYKMLLIRPYGYYAPTHAAEQIVAVDTIDAGPGDDVVVCMGSPARWSLGDVNIPVDAAVLAIVDRCQFAREAFAPGREATHPPLEPRPMRFLGDREPQALEWQS